MQRILLALSVGDGLAIAWLDSRPNWDDAGITAGLLLLSAGLFAVLTPRRPWLVALAVGLWIPLNGIVSTHNYSAVIALIFAFIGAYAGFGIRRLAISTPAKG